MSNKNHYRQLFPLKTHSPMNYSTQFVSIEGSNYQKTRNKSLPWLTSNDITIGNSSRKIALKSSPSDIVESKMKIPKSRNDLRIAKNRKRIELLSQPKFRVQNRSLKSSSTNAANTNENDDEKIKKLNVNDPSPSTSHRFRTVTPRLLYLAQPKIHDTSVYNFNQHCIGGVEKIEMAKMSKRLEELAEPKKLQFRTNKDPFKVNPKALKASCSTRVEELARPKGFSQPFPQLFQTYLDQAFDGS